MHIYEQYTQHNNAHSFLLTANEKGVYLQYQYIQRFTVQRLLSKHKSFVALFILIGVFSFSVCHASVMHQSMDGMDCKAQTFCVACPVPVVSDSPDLGNFLTQFEMLSEKSPCLPDPSVDSFYHPPR